MATTYTSTIEVKCRKEHTCLGCGAVYSYPFFRKVKGQGGSAERAKIVAQKNVAAVLEREVDLQPCPTCGLYQPDMIGQQRRRRHVIITWIGLVTLTALLIVRLAYGMRANEATQFISIACLAAFVAHMLVERSNPNRDLMGNTTLAADRVAEGTIQFKPGRVGPQIDDFINPPKSTLHRMALPLLLFGAGLAYSPEFIRSQNHWPLNPDCYPPVVGAGDSTRIYMDDRINSVKGYWRGSPNALLQTPDGKPIMEANATTNQNDWGSSISAKSSEKNTGSTPWVEVTLPAAGKKDLAGQTVHCVLDLKVDFPEMQGSSNFVTHHSTMSRTVDIRVAPAGSGTRYNQWWWESSLVGAFLVVACGIILVKAARALQRRATPTRTFV